MATSITLLFSGLQALRTVAPKVAGATTARTFTLSLARHKAHEDGADKPTVVYESPGSSLREPTYGISLSDPVYVVDPKPQQQQELAKPGNVLPKEAAPAAAKPGEPSYIYASPGSSVREPLYPVGERVVVIDPKPTRKGT